MDKLLTKKDLAERWQVTESSIDNWRRDGVISVCKGVPVVRFAPEYISEIEGMKLEKFSPLERRKLERELEEWKARAQKAENALEGAASILIGATYQRNLSIGKR